MFATLRYGREEGDEVECLDQTDKPPNQGQSNPHSACQACRSKKLKCSGEKSRCQRCKNRGYKCVYTNDKSGGQKRKHHAEKDGSRSSAPSKASSSNEMEAHSSESDATSSRRLSRYPPTPSSFRDGEISEMQRRRSQNLQQMGDDQVIRSMMESVADMEGTTMNESSAESDKELFSQLLAPFQTSDDLFAQVLEDSHENSDGGIVGMEDALMNLGNEHDHFTFDQHMASFANSPQFGLAGTPTSQPIFSPATSSRNGHSNKRLSTQAVSIPSCHSSSGYISSETSCQCTSTALRILETLAAHSKSGDLGTAEHALYSLKSNIGKCQELAQCSVCGRESGICILLIMLCEKITSAFEEVASSWEHQLEGFRRNTYRAHDTAGSGHGPLWHMDIDRIRVLIGEYQIDTVEERCEVFSALTLLQLNKLSTLMSELRSNALASNWESHLTTVKSDGAAGKDFERSSKTDDWSYGDWQLTRVRLYMNISLQAGKHLDI